MAEWVPPEMSWEDRSSTDGPEFNGSIWLAERKDKRCTNHTNYHHHHLNHHLNIKSDNKTNTTCGNDS